MKTKQIIAMVVAAVLFIIIGVSSVFTNIIQKKELALLGETAQTTFSWDSFFGMTADMGTDYATEMPQEKFTAIVPIKGTIMSGYSALETGGYDHDAVMAFLDALIYNEYNEAIVLYLDTPGGAVIDADEVYLKLLEYKTVTKRPVYAYVHTNCHSGGYYIAMAADKIIVNRNAMVGSVGVIVTTYDLSGLYEKLGVEEINITSGKNKAMFTGDDAATQEQVAMYQDIVDTMFDQFVGIVCEGRGMTEEEVLAFADGSVFSAKKALEMKLIDATCNTYEDGLNMISEEIGTDYYYDMPQTEEDIFSSLFMKLDSVLPKSETQALTELAEKVESKGLMYYAEP